MVDAAAAEQVGGAVPVDGHGQRTWGRRGAPRYQWLEPNDQQVVDGDSLAGAGSRA